MAEGSMIGSERVSGVDTQVAVLASDEAARALIAALRHWPTAEIRPLSWPSLKLPSATPTPDLVICEINDPHQARDRRRELGQLWPSALLVSCEPGITGLDAATTKLGTASREAGYHGHVLLDDVALQLPFFLRYAEQRRRTDTQLACLERLLNAVSRMHASLDQQCVAGAVLKEFQQWVTADSWLLYTVSDDHCFLELALSEGVRTRPQSLTLSINGSGLIERVLQQGEIALIQPNEDAEPGRNGSRKRTEGAVLCLPLLVDGQAVGVVEAIRNEESGTFDALDEQMLRELSRIASTSLNNALRFARTERLYMQDDLTRLYNSRYLRQFLDGEIKRSRRYGSPVSVAFVDLDGFKQVNDRYGHRVGSETLKEVAELFVSAVRETDVVARYGGDEFTLVLPETSASQALATAERLRRRLTEHHFGGGSGESFCLTASFGIAACPDHAQVAADLIEKADLAMYQAKAANKNNVKLAELRSDE